MTIAIVQEKGLATSAANPSVTFTSAPAIGNLMVLFISGTDPVTLGEDDDDLTEAPVGWARLYRDAGGRLNGYGIRTDAQSAADTGTHVDQAFVSVYVKYVTGADTSTIQTSASGATPHTLIAYELSGTFEPTDRSVVGGWTQASGHGNLITALNTDEGPIGPTTPGSGNVGPGLVVPEHACVFSVTRAMNQTPTAAFTHTFVGDRTDALVVSTGTPVANHHRIEIVVNADAAAGTYSDAVSWATASKAIGAMIALVDKGPYVAAPGLPAALDGVASNLTDAAAEDPPLAAQLTAGAIIAGGLSDRFDRVLTRKTARIAAHEALSARVLLAPHDPNLDVPVYGEPFTPSPDRVLDGIDMSYLLGFQFRSLPPGYTFKIPRGRFRFETTQTIRTSAQGITLQGEGLGADLPTFYQTVPAGNADYMLEFRNVSGLTLDRIRAESTNTQRLVFSAIGQNLFRYIPADYALPVLEEDWPDYFGPVEHCSAIYIGGPCIDITLTDIFTYGTWGDGITLQCPPRNVPNVERVVADHLDLRYTGRVACAILGVHDGTFTNVWSPNARRETFDLEDRNSDTLVFDTVYSDAFNEALSVGRCTHDLVVRNVDIAQGGDANGKAGPAYIVVTGNPALDGVPLPHNNYSFENIRLLQGEWRGGRRDWGNPAGGGDAYFTDAAPFRVNTAGVVEISGCDIPIASDARTTASGLFGGEPHPATISMHDNDFGEGTPPEFLIMTNVAGGVVEDENNTYATGVSHNVVVVGVGSKFSVGAAPGKISFTKSFGVTSYLTPTGAGV